MISPAATGVVAIEEAAAKQPQNKATAKEMREAGNVQDKKVRGSKLATATAKKETGATAKITGILCGAFAKAPGAPRAAPFLSFSNLTLKLGKVGTFAGGYYYYR